VVQRGGAVIFFIFPREEGGEGIYLFHKKGRVFVRERIKGVLGVLSERRGRSSKKRCGLKKKISFSSDIERGGGGAILISLKTSRGWKEK